MCPDMIRRDKEEIKKSIYQKDRIKHWDNIAASVSRKSSWSDYYHERLHQIYRLLVVPGQRVMEIGCGTGDLLAGLQPSFGLGIDLSKEMVQYASERHPDLHFTACDAHDLCLNSKFDVVILSDTINDLWDVQGVFQQIYSSTGPDTRIIINTYSRLWELPLAAVRKMGLAGRLLPQNWLTTNDISSIFNLTDFETIRCWGEILWPLNTPLLRGLLNRFAVKVWPFNLFALTNFVIAKPKADPNYGKKLPTVSVVVPARNEAGNIRQIFDRTPEMGGGTEILFVEGHSQDETWKTIEENIAKYPERNCRLIKQRGVGKGEAVRLGFSHSNGDIFMILDADLTVPPENLPRFYSALCEGKCEFVNGVRLIYPMEKRAMRFINLLGNKFFSIIFSWLLGQPVKDTLCGTKVLWKKDYDRIAQNRSYFGDFDPFGDFDLLFGAAKLNLKIMEVPVRYAERRYGKTNIQRWKHGLLLFRMVLFAMRRIKLV